MGNQAILSEKEARQRIDREDLNILTEIWEKLVGDQKQALSMHKADVLLYIVMKDPNFPRYNTKKLKDIVDRLNKDFNGYVEKNQMALGSIKERWGYVYLKLLDCTANDELSWREFIGGWAVATTGTLEEKANACFRLIDYDKDNFLSRDDVYG
eukprot:TRINITY_DN5229_c0_g1_i3.p1 TRINITY_DN5229_c0_g1~~TRINITY_DN5229_c0_g1_i3.p1  ORF type:complete len:169 (-),score=43.25 TRINITY_DN5229_c0_g1_i3:268-729(-)